MKTMSKSEIARKLGVSPSTFRRWLVNNRSELERLGNPYYSKLINPAGVKYLFDYYVIDEEDWYSAQIKSPHGCDAVRAFFYVVISKKLKYVAGWFVALLAAIFDDEKLASRTTRRAIGGASVTSLRGDRGKPLRCRKWRGYSRYRWCRYRQLR